MQERAVDERVESAADLAADLLRQAERCAGAGLLRQAQTLMAQVWMIAGGSAPDLSNIAAWEAAWLSLQLHSYAEAAEWFERVTHPPARPSRLWPAAVQTQARLCRTLAGPPPDPAPAAPAAPAASALPTLAITSLGRFQIARGDRALPPCKARKSIAILRYLLTRRHRSATKEELMELLWPGAGPREAAHSLHVAVSGLRRYLDLPNGGYLLFEDGCYTLNPAAPLEDDSAAFQQLSDEADQSRRAGDPPAAQRAYAAAVACYQGDYYVDDRDMDWAIGERERLLTRYLTNLDYLGRSAFQERRFEAALGYYQRLLDRDGYREDVHCQIMRCYAQLGRRGDALRQYERCAAILSSELGLEPMPETQDLYQSIMRADASG